MDKYRLVGERRSDNLATQQATESDEPIDMWEVRITQQGKPRNYISYAMNLFAQGKEKIVLKAMGRAINKAVTIAEILKRKMPLHQINHLTSSEIVDVFEPLEEGLDTVESKRHVSCMTITLSTTNEGIDMHDIGYQPPIPTMGESRGDFSVRHSAVTAPL
eukprot:CAMPEP_0204640782 /NCGR_PEP_ID=MMETSP0717-20131115/48774_1 /ASSEMBLY_ACC=CAM_ASM_000666 /TAXON_ID=230516 /ORGANISM="Chaetoceros curvisetus" /LENGTH=160 /DNA_ID=CAMNT_0051661295 /DNA_START=80 /DNA_END=562 /DNA_ORIENTATION=+